MCGGGGGGAKATEKAKITEEIPSGFGVDDLQHTTGDPEHELASSVCFQASYVHQFL